MLTTVSSKGRVYLQFQEGNNNEVSVAAYLAGLVQLLDNEDADWRGKSVLLLDNNTAQKTSGSMCTRRPPGTHGLRSLGLALGFAGGAPLWRIEGL